MRVYINFYQDDWVDWFPLAKFAVNNQVLEITELRPFFVNYSFHPHLDIESVKPNLLIWSASQKREVLNVHTMADRMEWILDIVKALLAEAKKKYKT